MSSRQLRFVSAIQSWVESLGNCRLIKFRLNSRLCCFRINGKYRLDEIIDIPEVMFSPARLRMRRFFDEILSALTLDTIQQADAHVSETVIILLFFKFIKNDLFLFF